MTSPSRPAPGQAVKEVASKAKQAAAQPWVEWVMRFGYVVRGAIYLIIGVLALQLVGGQGGETATPSETITYIGQQPFGQFLLALVALGLAGYALWGVIRAVFDPLQRGTDAKGLVERAGFLISALSYGVLCAGAVLLLMGRPENNTSGNVMPLARQQPWGPWLVGAYGLFWLINGGAQLYTAYTKHFMSYLHTGLLKGNERDMVTWTGRIGYAARGIVFAVVGIGILCTVFMGGQNAPGIDGALAALAAGPYGAIVLGLVALGLVLFGVFSIACAKWARVTSG